MNTLKKINILIMSAVIIFVVAECAYTLPKVDEVVSGNVEIQLKDEHTMDISATDKSIINFSSFDIAQHESVFVTLPSTNSQILNRVTGGSASEIFGTLNSNGIFILVNPNGIHVGETAQVNVGSLILSTRDITDSNFINGEYLFQKMSPEYRDMLLLNEGKITVSDGGFGVLIAGAIRNEGIITCNVGKIALASGDAVRLNIGGNKLISIAIDEKVASLVFDYDGKPITDQIKNIGTLMANGGIVILKAESITDVFRKTINLEGFVFANRFGIKEGELFLSADGDIGLAGDMEAMNIFILSKKDIEVDAANIRSNNGNITLYAEKVILSGENPTHLYGNITFHNLKVTQPGKEIYFEAGKTYTFLGSTYIYGQPGYEGLIKLLSSEEGKPWYLEFKGIASPSLSLGLAMTDASSLRGAEGDEAISIAYVALRDAHNLGETTKARPSTNWGNSTGWDLDPVWDGQGITLNWSDAANWDTKTVPTQYDTVSFNATSTKDSTVDANFGGTVAIFNIEEGYTGTISLQRDLTVTNSMTQAGGMVKTDAYTLETQGPIQVTGGDFLGTYLVTAEGVSSLIIPKVENAKYHLTMKEVGLEILSPAFKEGFSQVELEIISTKALLPTSDSSVRIVKTKDTINNKYLLQDGITVVTSYEPSKNRTLGANVIPIKQTITLDNPTNQTYELELVMRTITGAREVNWDGKILPVAEVPLVLAAYDKTAPVTEFAKDLGVGEIDGLDYFSSVQHTYTAGYFLTYVTPSGDLAKFDWRDVKDLSHEVKVWGEDEKTVITLTLSDLVLNSKDSLVIDPNYTLNTAAAYNVRYDGSAAGDQITNAAGSIAIGDVNGDSKADLVIGSYLTDNNSRTNSGSVWVIFSTLINGVGTTTGNNKGLNTGGNYNIRFDGAAANDQLGDDITIGNVNGDANNDLIIGAARADINGSASGSVYVIYSTIIDDYNASTGNNLDLNTGTNYNVRYDGALAGDWLGAANVVGDVNGDGASDLVMGAYAADNNNRVTSGSVYVIFSNNVADPGTTKSLGDGTNYNVRYDGAAASLFVPDSKDLIKIGDVNGDNLGDLVIGVPRADNNSRTNSGSVYVMYSTLISLIGGTGNNKDLGLAGSYNIRFDGAAASDALSQNEAIAIGDVNGDGWNDLILGAYDAGNNGATSGSVYVLDGNNLIKNITNTGNNKDLSTGTNYSIRYDGGAASEQLGLNGAIAVGDVNGDGKSDLAIGAYNADYNGGTNTGSVYVMYSTLVDDYLNSTNNNLPLNTTSNFNIRFDGGSGSDTFGEVIVIGDANGDAKSDLVVSARWASNNGSNSGSAYVIFSTLIDDITNTGNTKAMSTASNYSLRYDGTASDFLTLNEVMLTGDMDGDGASDLIVGTNAADNNGADSGSVWVIFAGTNTDSIAGTVYSDEGTTALGNQTVAVSINGAAAPITAESNATTGAYSIKGLLLDANDIITLYLEDETANAVTVTLTDGGDMTNIHLFQDRLITRHDNSGSLTSANLATADNNGDTDISAIYSVDGSNALAMAASTELFIPTGHTYVPGANIDVVDIDINGTLTLSTYSANVSGTWDATGGTFTTSGTITFDATSGTKDIISNSNSFQNVVFNDGGSEGSATFELEDAFDVNGNLTITGAGGTLDTKLNENNSITIAGSWVNNDIFTPRSGTVTFDSAGPNSVNNGTSSFYHFVVNKSGGADNSLTNQCPNASGGLVVNGNLTITNGTLELGGRYLTLAVTSTFSNDGILRLQGDEVLTNFTQDTNSGTTHYDGDLDNAADTYTINNFGDVDYYNLLINESDSQDVFRLGAALATAGTFIVTTGSFNANGQTVASTGLVTINGGTYLASTAAQTFNSGLTISSGAFTGSSGTVDINGALTLSGGVLTAPSGNLNISGSVTHSNGTFTHNSGTVIFDGSGATIDVPTTDTFNNVTFNATDAAAKIVAAGDTIIVGGALTLTDGAINTGTVSARGAIITQATTFDGGTATLKIDGSGDQTLTGSGSNSSGDLPNIEISKTGGTLSLASMIRLDGNWTYTQGTVDATTNDSTIVFFGGSIDGQSPSSTMVFDNILITAPGAALGGNLDVNGNFTVGAGTIAQTDYTMNVAGNFVIANGATFTKSVNNSALTFDGTGGLSDGNAVKQDLGVVIIGGDSITRTLASGIKMTSLTINSGNTFSLAGSNFEFNSSTAVDNSGTFKLHGSETLTNVSNLDTNSGTVIYEGRNISENLTINEFGSPDYFNLTINDTNATRATFITSSGLTIAGTLTILSGTLSPSANNVTITSNSTTNINGANAVLTLGSGSFTDSGAFNLSAGTVNGGSGTITITGLMTISGGTYTASSGTMNLDGGFTVSGGTFTGSGILDTVNVTISGGTLVAPNTINVSGNWAKTSGTFTPGTGTVTFDRYDATIVTLNSGGTAFYSITYRGTGTLQLTSNLETTHELYIDPWAGTFNTNGYGVTAGGSLRIDGGIYLASTGTQTLNSNLTVWGGIFTGSTGQVAARDVFIYSGTLAAPSGTFTVSRNWTKTGGTFTPGANTVTFNGSGSQTLNSGGSAFNNVIHSGAGTLQLSTNNFTINDTFTNSGGTFDANGLTTTVAGLVTVNGGEYQAKTAAQTFNSGLTISGGTFTGSTGAVDVNGTLTLSSGTLTAPTGLFTISDAWTKTGGTFTPGANTVTFDGAGTQDLNSGGTSFNNISHTGSGTLRIITNNLAIGGIFTNSNGTFDTNGLATTVTGLATVSGGEYQAKTASQNFSGGLTISGGTYSGGSANAIITGTVTLSAGTLNIANGSFSVRGSWLKTGGTFNQGENRIYFGSTAAQTFTLNSGGSSFSMIEFDGSGTLRLAGDLNASLWIYIPEGVTGTIDCNGYSVTTLDLRIDGGTYLASTGNQTILRDFQGFGGTFTGSTGAVDINRNFSLTAGTFTAPSGLFTVAGSWTKTGGTFTHNNSTVILDGGNQTISGSNTFYNLRKTVTSAYTLTFAAGATQTISNEMRFEGAIGQNLSLRSTIAGTQYRVNPQTIPTVLYLDLQDFNNTNPIFINAVAKNCINSNNNTGWIFVVTTETTRSLKNVTDNNIVKWDRVYFSDPKQYVTQIASSLILSQLKLSEGREISQAEQGLGTGQFSGFLKGPGGFSTGVETSLSTVIKLDLSPASMAAPGTTSLASASTFSSPHSAKDSIVGYDDTGKKIFEYKIEL